MAMDIVRSARVRPAHSAMPVARGAGDWPAVGGPGESWTVEAGEREARLRHLLRLIPLADAAQAATDSNKYAMN